VVIGVTNVIPMFGPFIGAIPSAFLLLLVSPKQCLVFIIFIVILQQIDGNIIGPRIIGNSTGISALYVTIAILLFGKLFGFIGMILGVPLFATIYYIVKRLTEHSLRNQGLPIETSRYLPGLTIHGSLPENSEEN
ncbi:MAG: AI-2E family transporter, partial [Clostridia bacterium]|nr:AI-2E family transporter [Clostridia bacterium]